MALTLRRFVEAAGGSLELIIHLPDTGPIRLVGLGLVVAKK
ncbi:DNA-binding protein [Myxococcota bacterium]|nr:DNA-binding protein [Myxococcota bacterium]